MKRYQIRWNNGTWKIFDMLSYSDVVLIPTHKEAEAAERYFNNV